MSNKPVILLAWGPCFDNQFFSYGMMLSKTYEQAVAKNGGIPLMALDELCAEEYVSMADGLIIPGAMFETAKPGVPHEARIEAGNYRESFQSELFRVFFREGKPIMGICEGCQKINCCLGGDLSLRLEEERGVSHQNTAHTIRTEKDSLIHKLWGDEPFVNSNHNYYIRTPGDDIVITAVSDQGNCEAFEHRKKPIFAFQFHPERMRGEEPNPIDGADGDLLFREFIRICAEK